MRVIKAANYEEVSRRAAMLIAAQVLIKPNAVLGLATGSSPIGTYQNLVAWHRAGDLDFSGVTILTSMSDLTGQTIRATAIL